MKILMANTTLKLSKAKNETNSNKVHKLDNLDTKINSRAKGFAEPNSSNAKSPALAIKTQDLTKRFGTRPVLNNISLEVPTGAFLSIFGPNGAGKTTLLRILSTLLSPTSGTVEILGLDAKEDPDKVRAKIGLISHNSMLYDNLTAQENLMFFAKLYGVKNPSERVKEMLAAVELSSRRIDCVNTFSRGMVQRLSIARALIHDPEIVFLDEPYSGLDPHAIEVFDNILQTQRANKTFVMVSHDLEKGFSMSTHVLVLAKTQVVKFARQDELDFESFSKIYSQAAGEGVL